MAALIVFILLVLWLGLPTCIGLFLLGLVIYEAVKFGNRASMASATKPS